ncbi:GNAT family N-acetyltransferase [Pontibacter locisalis]|uniref:GNAT family N-acetyltransferase n=1 Tax=Pontibacter locisalis TaxID=1719035 RepID=A0ABW5IJZ1_9BACT
MIEVVRYNEKYRVLWDAFVKASKNGTFLLLRDYMEYHAERFTDHSLLFFKKDRLIGLMPANEQGEVLCSHAGLTYGGIVTDARMKSGTMLEAFEVMKLYLQKQGMRRLEYKSIPHIYHRAPAEEDLFALFRCEAKVTRRDLLSVIEPSKALGYSKKRRWEVVKSRSRPWHFACSLSFDKYMQIVSELLLIKYNAVPVHTAEEVRLLANRFPEHIKLFVASDEEEEIAAGVLIYETATVAHCQYIGYTERGKVKGALSALIDYLLKEVYPHKLYFDLGASMGQHGLLLNEKLLANKESYGARAVVHDFYELEL